MSKLEHAINNGNTHTANFNEAFRKSLDRLIANLVDAGYQSKDIVIQLKDESAKGSFAHYSTVAGSVKIEFI